MTDLTKTEYQLSQQSGYRQIVRVLRWYEKSGDRLVGETPLPQLPLAELQMLFGESEDNPMYDCYPVQAAQALKLQPTIAKKLDLASYNYFLECDAV